MTFTYKYTSTKRLLAIRLRIYCSDANIPINTLIFIGIILYDGG